MLLGVSAFKFCFVAFRFTSKEGTSKEGTSMGELHFLPCFNVLHLVIFITISFRCVLDLILQTAINNFISRILVTDVRCVQLANFDILKCSLK